MNPYSIPPLAVAIITISFGILAIFQGKQKRVKFTFALMTLTVSIWLFGYSRAYSATNYEMALFWVRFVYLGVIYIPTASYHFVINFLNIKRKKEIFLYYIISTIFLILCQNRNFISGLHKYPWGYYAKASFLQNAFLIFFFFVLLRILYYLFMNIKKRKLEASPLEVMRIRYLLFSFFIAIFAATDFLPTYGIQFYPLGFICISFYAVLTTIAILRYRLMDINIVATRATIFSFVYLIVLGLPIGIGYKLLGYGVWVILLLATALFATAGPFIYTYLQRKAEERLRIEEFLAHQALNNLAQNMMRFTRLELLLRLIVHQVVKIMKVYSASVYLKDEQDRHYRLRASWSIKDTSAKQSEFAEDSSLIRDILLRRVPIVAEELRFGQTSKVSSHLKKVQSELQRADAAVVIPAFKGDNLFGFLMLSPRRDNRMYTQEDLNLLMLLANQSVLAIENAQLFEKEKLFLAEKSRRDALADMAPGVAHQFNNRLQSICLSADINLLLLGKKPFEEFTKEELKEIVESAKEGFARVSNDALKGKDIANAILNKGRAKLTYEERDLLPIIVSSISLLKMSRTKESLKGTPEPEINIATEKDLPRLFLNESLVQDIFYNLIDNARDAIIIKHKLMSEGELTADEFPYKGRINIHARREGSKIIVSIKDNGIGMKEKDKKRLFVPYFTTKATALKGTGLGLWTIRSFIEDHRGTISVESDYTKGTTFFITFPIKRGNYEEKTPDS